MAEILTAAATTLADPLVWGVVVAAALYGVAIGSMPGLTATMGVALFVPVTFWLPPVPALAGIATMVACAIFAGDIPTTLLRIPGTPPTPLKPMSSLAKARPVERWEWRWWPASPAGSSVRWY
jgi:TctA family transporter